MRYPKKVNYEPESNLLSTPPHICAGRNKYLPVLIIFKKFTNKEIFSITAAMNHYLSRENLLTLPTHSTRYITLTTTVHIQLLRTNIVTKRFHTYVQIMSTPRRQIDRLLPTTSENAWTLFWAQIGH